MKIKNILRLALVATILVSCNGKSNKVSTVQNKSPEVQSSSQPVGASDSNSSGIVTVNKVLIKEIVNAYLQMKNAFTEDNSVVAATAGKKLEAALNNFDKSALNAAQKKTYEDVEADAREHAEHIGANGGNIAHQREHFVLLSKDIYDLIKTFGGGQLLYRDFDPMFNSGKGAYWISETKDIKNPYMGKAMLTSGSVIEEIK